MDAAAATPNRSVLKPTMMRSDDRRLVTRGVDASDTLRAGDRENVANGVVDAALTVPESVAPLLATNEADAPAICDDVTRTTCVPAVGASVHFTDDLPSLSVVVAVADTVPPFVGAHVSATPETDLPAASSTCTTSEESSGAETSPDWFAPEMTLMVVGVCGIGV